ncbi:NO-inducible flavohemoprotein [Pullulanibacillus sp. KACC 23026]|uniref:NO-inducible flavohemoprotein n=1 Tax=Pullulanibacillus sp. KACC 23026 TaxID=3028315 RepID=UPI0023B16779|nr:NO-inducible flavohemoprotein [Pullulanibacillus sp. KACC 23026]WEG13931.1 NO-inducible flavohemoprotein [Pullulanibacillus sp. KACC 23026]
MLSQETISIIKSTVPVLEKYGQDITKRFYQRLFENYPELKNIFNQTNQRKSSQQQALANMVYQAAKHIDRLNDLSEEALVVAHKHVSIGIRPDQYPIVGEQLLGAIKDILGDAATDTILNAWAEAYGVIAQLFIDIETQMREANLQKGAWDGYKEFVVANKIQESDGITSFYLKPADGQQVPVYSPGQYISVKVKPEGESHTHIRQYSLSDAYTSDFYRISVKKEEGRHALPEGIVSNYLHDEIEEGQRLLVSAPQGKFTLELDNKKPIVILSGGVGLTPVTSMVKTWHEKGGEQPITWIHAAINGRAHALKDEMQTMAKENPNLTLYTIYENPTLEDQREQAYDKEGRLDMDWLKGILPSKDAEFYFCGPEPFMKLIYNDLLNWGVPEASLHFEFFGPTSQLIAN